MADEPIPASAPADTSPAAKDAAIAKLKEAEPNIHFDTAYNILRADPAFQPENLEDMVYVIQHWAAAAKKEEKAAEPVPAA